MDFQWQLALHSIARSADQIFFRAQSLLLKFVCGLLYCIQYRTVAKTYLDNLGSYGGGGYWLSIRFRDQMASYGHLMIWDERGILHVHVSHLNI